MKTTTVGRNNGIQWTFLTQLEDLEFADDLVHTQMQYRTTRLESKFLATRLRVSWGKANLTTTNTATNIPHSVQGEPSEKSTLLPILAALWIKRAAQTETSLPVRVGKTRAAFITLKNVWASQKIAITTKLCTLNANVKSILPYRSEKLKGEWHFQDHKARAITKNEELWERENCKDQRENISWGVSRDG